MHTDRTTRLGCAGALASRRTDKQCRPLHGENLLAVQSQTDIRETMCERNMLHEAQSTTILPGNAHDDTMYEQNACMHWRLHKHANAYYDFVRKCHNLLTNKSWGNVNNLLMSSVGLKTESGAQKHCKSINTWWRGRSNKHLSFCSFMSLQKRRSCCTQEQNRPSQMAPLIKGFLWSNLTAGEKDRTEPIQLGCHGLCAQQDATSLPLVHISS